MINSLIWSDSENTQMTLFINGTLNHWFDVFYEVLSW